MYIRLYESDATDGALMHRCTDVLLMYRNLHTSVLRYTRCFDASMYQILYPILLILSLMYQTSLYRFMHQTSSPCSVLCIKLPGPVAFYVSNFQPL